jgi:transcriptional regulator with XRE-family HTH domain
MRQKKADTPLRNTRRARTLTQAQLASLVGVSQQTIAKAERGIVELRPDVQVLVATILGSTRQELFPPREEAVAS